MASPARIVNGADVELGNFVLDPLDERDTCAEASRALLREIAGHPADEAHTIAEGRGAHAGDVRPVARDPLRPLPLVSLGGRPDPEPSRYNAQDWGRKYLATNGGCVYIDLDHLELCIPEVSGARDHVAAWHAMLRIARRAMEGANARRSRGRIHVLVNNSDGLGQSWGAHLSFLVTRRAWRNLFERKIQHQLLLAAYQISSIVFTGQGKVGSENAAPFAPFQLSQRADYFETLTGPQTTYRRPVVNSRNEALCGRYLAGSLDPELARLHCIFYDANLQQTATFLKVGVMSLILAMLTEERIGPRLTLDDPLDALRTWSHDPTLRATAAMADGRRLTALELQDLFLDEAKRFAARGGGENVADRDEILRLWEDTLAKLRSGDWPALARRLDWVLKLRTLRRAMRRRPDLSWTSPALKRLDHLYADLDGAAGLYWVHERAGRTERVVEEQRIDWLTRNPPEDTRAWTRAMSLRRAAPREVVEVDWDAIRFRVGRSGAPRRTRVAELCDPLGSTRADNEEAVRRSRSLEELLDALCATEEPPATRRSPRGVRAEAGKGAYRTRGWGGTEPRTETARTKGADA